MNEAPARSSKLPAVVGSIALVALTALGFWQLERADEKATLISQFEQRTVDVPILLNQRIAGLVTGEVDRQWWRFRRIEAAGRFRVDRQYLLDNRTESGAVGYHVLSILELEGVRRTGVLVNRGWVSQGRTRQDLPDVSASAELVSIRAIADFPRRHLVLGDSGYGAGGWPRVVQRVEPEIIARETGLTIAPIILLMDPDQAGGFSRKWIPHLGIGPERHQAYAFQWFSLAVALVVVWIVVSRRTDRGAES